MAIPQSVQSLLDLAGGDDARQLAFGYSKPGPTDSPSSDRMKARLAVAMKVGYSGQDG